MTEDRTPATTDEAQRAVYRPSADGGLEAAPPDEVDYREQLRSRRWNAAPLENPEAEKTDPRIAVGAILALSLLTLLVLIVGYGVGLWDVGVPPA